MIAIVKSINPVRAMVRRNYRTELVQIPARADLPRFETYAALRIGHRIEVKRETNNPYLVLIGMEAR